MAEPSRPATASVRTQRGGNGAGFAFICMYPHPVRQTRTLKMQKMMHSKTSLFRSNWERPLVQSSESQNYRSATENIVMHMAIARQRFGKHIPEVTLSTI
jgi:hypothetical protein